MLTKFKLTVPPAHRLGVLGIMVLEAGVPEQGVLQGTTVTEVVTLILIPLLVQVIITLKYVDVVIVALAKALKVAPLTGE